MNAILFENSLNYTLGHIEDILAKENIRVHHME